MPTHPIWWRNTVSGTFGLGRLFGVRIQVHFSWVFIFALIAWSLASSWLPSRYVDWSTTQYWTVGVIGSTLLFVCVLIHELSHSLEAIRRGLRVKSITLFFLGGFSQIDGESRSASEEFWVSVVGPIASLGLACLFGLMYLNLRASTGPFTALTQYLMFVNLLVGLFNLIPAFPLDGGRVLRSLVWRATQSQERATRVASLTGSVLGFALIGVGVVAVFTNTLVTGIWLMFIGWFIQSTASSVRQSGSERVVVSGRTVGDAMDKRLQVVPPGISIQRLVDEHMVAEMQRAYLVMLGDTFYGLITVSDVRRVPIAVWSGTWVSEAMTKVQDAITLSPDDPLEEGLKILADRNIQQAVVMESDSPVGMLTRAGVLRVMEVSQLAPVSREEPTST
jgi:Zn-dependent protease/CBS domain-containing protein